VGLWTYDKELRGAPCRDQKLSKEILEFVLAFILFSLALATGLYWIVLESLPQPNQLAPRAYSYPVYLTVYREGMS